MGSGGEPGIGAGATGTSEGIGGGATGLGLDNSIDNDRLLSLLMKSMAAMPAQKPIVAPTPVTAASMPMGAVGMGAGGMGVGQRQMGQTPQLPSISPEQIQTALALIKQRLGQNNGLSF